MTSLLVNVFRLRLRKPRLALWEIMAAVAIIALALAIRAGFFPVMCIIAIVFFERIGLSVAQILVAVALLRAALGLFLPGIAIP
jgi:hypothetical protein